MPYISDKYYKIDNKGKLRVIWFVRRENTVSIFYGIVDSPALLSPSNSFIVHKGKNEGKANATTKEEQAQKELEARLKKKIAEGYCNTPEEARRIKEEGGKFFQPMLAETLEKAKKKMGPIHEYILDPKFDGMRMVTGKGYQKSRRGKDIPSAQFISDALKPFFDKYPTVYLDGELYNHEYKDNFEELMSLCRKQRVLTDEESEKVQSTVQYYIYDWFDTSNPDQASWARKTMLALKLNLFIMENNLQSMIKVCTGIRLNMVYPDGEDMEVVLKEYTDRFVHKEGYEGLILRHEDSIYENKRSKNLIKVKLFDDDEFEILRLESERTAKGDIIAGAMYVQLPDGESCKCGVKGSEAKAKAMWDNQSDLIGLMATVRYFGKTKYDKLRMGVVIDIDRWSYE